MHGPAAIPEHRRNLDAPVTVIESAELRRIAVTQALRLHSSHESELPARVIHPAEADIALGDQEPVVGKRRIPEAGQERIGEDGIVPARIRALARGDRQSKRVIVEIVSTDVVEQRTGACITCGGEARHQEQQQSLQAGHPGGLIAAHHTVRPLIRPEAPIEYASVLPCMHCLPGAMRIAGDHAQYRVMHCWRRVPERTAARQAVATAPDYVYSCPGNSGRRHQNLMWQSPKCKKTNK